MNPELEPSFETLVHEYTTLIRERHLDSFGHVNNAQYMMLFEEARWEMCTSRGYGLKDVEQTQVGTAVLECSIRFKRELTLRELITLRSKVLQVGYKSVTIRQEILKEDGKLAADSSFLMGCFDLKARKLMVPPPIWLAAITGIKS